MQLSVQEMEDRCNTRAIIIVEIFLSSEQFNK